MSILPLGLWVELDDSLAQIELRLSPERARARVTELAAALPPDGDSESLYVSLAAVALVGALACRLDRERQDRERGMAAIA